MDYILFPYVNNLQVDLVKKRKSNGKAQLVLSDSLYIKSVSNFKDSYYLDDYKIEDVIIEGTNLYHIVDGQANEETYTMTLDLSNRRSNMAMNLGEKIIILLFKRLYSIDLTRREKGALYFNGKGVAYLNKIVHSVEGLANEIIASSLDVTTTKSQGKYYMKLASLGISQISYPVPSNTAELSRLLFTQVDLGQELKVSYQCGPDLIAQEAKNSKILQSSSQLFSKNPSLTSQELMEEKQDLEARLEASQEKLHQALAANIKVFNKDGLDLVFQAEDDLDAELAYHVAAYLNFDLAVFSEKSGHDYYFVLINRLGQDIEESLTRTGKIYPVKIQEYQEGAYKGRIDSNYFRRFFRTLTKDIKKS